MAQTSHFENRCFPVTGEHYVPLVNRNQSGYIYAHAVQTVQADPQKAYELWKNVDLIPRWQEQVISCTVLDETTSHWIMGNPADPHGRRIEFDSKIVRDVPGREIAWETSTGDLQQSGSVIFSSRPAGRGTLILLQESVKVPGGSAGEMLKSAKDRGTTQTVIENLRHFKELIETGEIPTVKGQPHGPRGLSGAAKEWMYGETNPTPPGTSEAA